MNSMRVLKKSQARRAHFFRSTYDKEQEQGDIEKKKNSNFSNAFSRRCSLFFEYLLPHTHAFLSPLSARQSREHKQRTASESDKEFGSFFFF